VSHHAFTYDRRGIDARLLGPYIINILPWNTSLIANEGAGPELPLARATFIAQEVIKAKPSASVAVPILFSMGVPYI